MDEASRILARSEEFRASAQADEVEGRWNAAQENARTACELAGKAMLLHATGDYPRKHAIGGALYDADLIPLGIDPARLSRLLKERTRADYGFFNPVPAEDAREAVGFATCMVAAARERLE